jgi:glycosyltransferase involved in cell wall biosynthesis
VADLTICIPSYNRVDKISELLVSILCQLEENKYNLEVIVLDNCSSENYLENFKNNQLILSALKSGILKIHRNVSNIGMSANSLKAFEIAKSKWLWIISDDDTILPNAFQILFSNLNTISDDLRVIKFTQSNIVNLEKFKIINNLKKFIDYNSISKYHFYDFIFISSCIYRANDFKKILNIGYLNSHTYIPHFLMITEYVKNGGKILNLDYEIIKYKIPQINYSYGLVGGLGVGGIKYINLNLNKKYEKKYLKLFFPYNDFKVIIDLYYYTKKKSVQKYEYFVKNYLSYARVARTPVKMFLLYIFFNIGKNRLLFDILLHISCKISATFRTHHEEISKKYL